jgi:alanine racemase
VATLIFFVLNFFLATAHTNKQPSVFDESWVAAAAAALANSSNSSAVLNLHVAVDTGLGREGCLPAP